MAADTPTTKPTDTPATTDGGPAESVASTGTNKVTMGCIQMELKDGMVMASKVNGKCDCSLNLEEGVKPEDAIKLSKMLHNVGVGATA